MKMQNIRFCEFCDKFGGHENLSPQWFDVALKADRDFVVVPGLGGFVEGYLMIVTRAHVRNFGQLPEEQIAGAERLKNEVRRILRSFYSDSIVFEHGAASVDGLGGSCINHAHLQCLPFDHDLLPELAKRHALTKIERMSRITELSLQDKPYIYYEDQAGNMVVCDAGGIPSQYMRRLIADVIGIPDQWDYAVYRREALIRNTIARLTPWPEGNHSQA